MSKIQSTLIVSRVGQIKREDPSIVRRAGATLSLRVAARFFLRRGPDGVTRDHVPNIRRRVMARPARGGKKISGRRGRRRKTPRARISLFLGNPRRNVSSDMSTPREPTPQERRPFPSSSSQELSAAGFHPFQTSGGRANPEGGGQHLAGSRAIACVPDPRD